MAALALRSPGVAGIVAVLAACFAIVILHVHTADGGILPRIGAFVLWCVALVMGITAFVGRPRKRAAQFPLPGSILEILRLSPREFETLVADLFRRQGYRVEEVGRHGQGDGGIDLIMRRDGDPIVEHLVQCKKYGPEKRVTVSQVRDFIGAMAIRRTRCEGLIVTSGTFTADASTTATAAGPSLRLIAGDELLAMLRSANLLTPAVKIFAPPQPTSPPPDCPKCHITMLWKVAGPGRHHGNPFWGCPNFPRCSEKIDAT
jgi:restriction system protein